MIGNESTKFSCKASNSTHPLETVRLLQSRTNKKVNNIQNISKAINFGNVSIIANTIEESITYNFKISWTSDEQIRKELDYIQCLFIYRSASQRSPKCRTENVKVEFLVSESDLGKSYLIHYEFCWLFGTPFYNYNIIQQLQLLKMSLPLLLQVCCNRSSNLAMQLDT